MRHIQSQAFPFCQICRKIEPVWEFVKWRQAWGNLKEWTELEWKLWSDFPCLKALSVCMVIYVTGHCVTIVSPPRLWQVSSEGLCCSRYSAEGLPRGGRGLSYYFRFSAACLTPSSQQQAEKAVAPHSSPRAWKIPWTEEPGGLQSVGSLRVGHDWATSRSLFTFLHWRRRWHPTPVFLPGESWGWRSPEGCLLWGRTESDKTEAT